jgi:hypothetical protein
LGARSAGFSVPSPCPFAHLTTLQHPPSAERYDKRYEAELSPSRSPKEPPEHEETPGGGGDHDCSDFASRSQAQRHLLPGDPYGLDSDGDGVACEELP